MEILSYQLSQLKTQGDEHLILTPEEIEHYSKREECYLRARCQLKRELARYSQQSLHNIHLRSNEHGKPHWEAQPQIHFNISHAADILLIAIDSSPIGIDVERIHPRNFSGIAPRFMAEPQLTQFRERGCPSEEFFACWCSTEALIKQAGLSIWQALERPYIYRDGQIELLFESSLKIELWQPRPNYIAALAHNS